MGPRNVVGWGTCQSHVSGQTRGLTSDKSGCHFKEGQNSFWLEPSFFLSPNLISVYTGLPNHHCVLVHFCHAGELL